MVILGYIILFVVIGFFIRLLVKEDALAWGVIFVISVGWFFVMGPWAIATFIELSIGYAFGSAFLSSSSGGSTNLASDIKSDIAGGLIEGATEGKFFNSERWNYNAFTRLIQGILKFAWTIAALIFTGMLIWGFISY